MKTTNKKGFTLIEVVLVLAIGGLIFLLAFLAFQQVSRNRRDTQRRADAGRLVAEIQNYASDNKGSLPANSINVSSNLCTGGTAPPTGSFQAFLRNYMCTGSPASFKSPTGSDYTVRYILDPDPVQVSTISFLAGYTCNFTATSPNKFIITIQLESGSVCREG